MPRSVISLAYVKKQVFFYELDKTTLKQVNTNPYLGLIVSENLTLGTHTLSINNIFKKANSTLGFLKRNLKNCSLDCSKLAYITLVRSTLEYGSVTWDPYLVKDINSIEKIQRQAARFIARDYISRENGSIQRMLEKLNLDTLQQRRKNARIVFLFEIVRGMVPAIDSASYLTLITNKRKYSLVEPK